MKVYVHNFDRTTSEMKMQKRCAEIVGLVGFYQSTLLNFCLRPLQHVSVAPLFVL